MNREDVIPLVKYAKDLEIFFTDAELARLDHIKKHRREVDGWIKGQYIDGTSYITRQRAIPEVPPPQTRNLDERMDYIKQLYASGMGTIGIGEELGYSSEAIRIALKRHGVKRKKPGGQYGNTRKTT